MPVDRAPPGDGERSYMRIVENCRVKMVARGLVTTAISGGIERSFGEGLTDALVSLLIVSSSCC